MSNIKNNLKFHYGAKKSVALILATIVLVGFSPFNIARAETSATPAVVQAPAPTPPILFYSDNSTTPASEYSYRGNGLWHIFPYKNDNIYISTSDMQAHHFMSRADVNKATQYDTDLREWNHTNATITTPADGASVWVSGLKTLANYAGGIVGIAFGPTVAILAFLELVHAVTSLIVAMSGFLFDQSIGFAILNIKSLFDAQPVVDIWAMLRDLINISFIFILLYIAITKIIGNWGVKAKTTIVNVIISAIFINFSMFITKILIDIGNMVAVQLFNQISIGLNSVSAIIFSSLGLLSFAKSALSLSGQFNMMISLLLQITLSIVLIYVFLMGAFILIGRIVMLVLLAITSPIGFVGKTIPGLGEWSSGWWKSLIDQILVAPALMFILLIVTRLLQGNYLQKLVVTNNTAFNFAPPPIDVAGFLYYSLIIILLIKGMKFVKKLSGEVAGTIVKVAGAVAIGAAAVVGAPVALPAMRMLGSALGSTVAGVAGAVGGGDSKVAKWGSRFALSSKKIPDLTTPSVKKFGSEIGKITSDKYDKTGPLGWAKTFAREKVISGIKEATGGIVDAKKLEKWMEKAKKDIETNVTKKAEALGPQKDIDRQKQLEDIKANITTQAKIKLKVINPELGEAPKEKDVENAKNTLAEKTKVKEEKEKVLKEKEKNLASKTPGTDAHQEAQKVHNVAKEEYTEAHNDFSLADQKVNNFKKYAEALKEEEKKVADEMGTSMDKIVEEEKDLVTKIADGVKARNEYIKSISDQGTMAGWWKTGILFGDDRKKLIEKIKAQKGKYSTAEESFLKKLKKSIEAKEKEGVDIGEEQKEEKPKPEENK